MAFVPRLVLAVMVRLANVRVVVLELALESRHVQTVHGELARLLAPVKKCVAMESTMIAMAL